ncbi:MAG: DUF4394 domain-containing protein [Phycisphaerales bacterium]
MKRSLGLLGVVALAGTVTSATQAEQIYGITGTTVGVSLVSFDSASPGTAAVIGALTGTTPNHQVTAIDFRPATGELYALSIDFTTGTSAQLYTVNLATGALTTVGAGFAIAGNLSSRVSMDFNPTVDRVRIVTGSRQNYRAHPVTGALVLQDGNLTYAVGDANEGATPAIVGAAYTNNFAGATTTTLFGWDFNNDRLVSIIPPNSGTLNTIGGPAGFVTSDGGVGFDISGVTGTAYFSYTDINDGSERFATMSLATGLLTDVGEFGPGIQLLDISAVIPTPGATALLGLAGIAALRRRR